MVSTTVETRQLTHDQTHASVALEEPTCEGRVELRIHGSTTVRSILFFRRALELSGAARIICLSPVRDERAYMFLELLRPLRLATFLRLLPGVFWVDDSWTQNNGDPVVADVILEEALLPCEAQDIERAFMEAVLAAIVVAQ